MKRSLTILTLAAVLTSALPAFALTLPSTGTDYAAESQYLVSKMDTDKDGKVSKTEHEAFADQMFNAADTNKDSFVSVEELTAAKQKQAADMSANTGYNARYNNAKKDITNLRSHLLGQQTQ